MVQEDDSTSQTLVVGQLVSHQVLQFALGQGLPRLVVNPRYERSRYVPDVGRALATQDARLSDAGVLEQDHLHFGWGDLVVFILDHLLNTVNEVKVAIVILVDKITRLVEAVLVKRLLRFLGVVEVSEHEVVRADTNLAHSILHVGWDVLARVDVYKPELYAGLQGAHGTRRGGPGGQRAEDEACLRSAIHLEDFAVEIPFHDDLHLSTGGRTTSRNRCKGAKIEAVFVFVLVERDAGEESRRRPHPRVDLVFVHSGQEGEIICERSKHPGGAEPYAPQ